MRSNEKEVPSYFPPRSGILNYKIQTQQTTWTNRTDQNMFLILHLLSSQEQGFCDARRSIGQTFLMQVLYTSPPPGYKIEIFSTCQYHNHILFFLFAELAGQIGNIGGRRPGTVGLCCAFFLLRLLDIHVGHKIHESGHQSIYETEDPVQDSRNN